MALFGRKTQDETAGSGPATSSPPPPKPADRPDVARAVQAQGQATSAAAHVGGTAAASTTPGRVAASARALVKVYGSGSTQVVALEQVDVDVYAGEFTAIMGPSGSGKSTLMHCMAGLDHITQGEVTVGDAQLSQLSDKQLTHLRRDKVGFIFQAFNLIPTLTAEENILLPLSIAGRKPDEQWYRTVVDTTGLGDRLKHKPSELSGGQQQRVACARALTSRPDIVFADEPTGNLDSRSSAEVLGFLRRSVDEFGQTIVMVTHDATAAAYTDRVIFLADGHIVSELRNPTPEKVLETMTGLDRRRQSAAGAPVFGGAPAPAGASADSASPTPAASTGATAGA